METPAVTVKKTTLWKILGFLALVGIAVFFYSLFSSDSRTTQQTGTFQDVVITQQGLNYADVIVQANVPIRVHLDSSVSGCLRSLLFTLNGQRYTKYLKTPSDTLELPALSPGTYPFSCTMGMGHGKLVVK